MPTTPRNYDIDPEWASALRADPCAYCGRPARDLDHIIAVTHEGDDGWENLTASCGRCNKSKYAEPLLIFLWKRSVSPPEIRTPQPGVHWRTDIKKWAAYVHCARRYQLGHYNTQEEAIAAIRAWHPANPEAMSPRARRTQERDERIRELWAQGLTMREMADQLGVHPKAVSSVIERIRRSRGGLPPRGRGAPGGKRATRKREKHAGRGYSHNAQSPARPWLVQVQSDEHKLVARFGTEEEARAAVAAFREAHPRRQKESPGWLTGTRSLLPVSPSKRPKPPSS